MKTNKENSSGLKERMSDLEFEIVGEQKAPPPPKKEK